MHAPTARTPHDSRPPAAGADAPLRLRGLVKDYGAFTLGPVDLTVPRGFVTGFVGVNGAGKSTTIRAALGLAVPDAGEVDLVDHALVGTVLDAVPYVGTWTCATVGCALAPFYPAWDQGRYDELLAWAGIDPRKRVKELSRGMGIKLQLAVALSHGAELLILDEPTAGLDPLARSEALDLLAEFMLDETHAVLFSTHITTDLDRIADHIVLIHDGRIRAALSREELVDGYRMVRAAGRPAPEVRGLIRGLREHGAGWTGLMATEDTVHLAASGAPVVVEEPTLDEIVVHLAKDPTHV